MIYKITAHYFHGGTTSKNEYIENIYYVISKDIVEAISKFNNNLKNLQIRRPQCNEKIYEIKEADSRVAIIT